MKRLGAALADWLDNRTGFRRLRHHALDEPLPAGTGWWFTLGSVLLFGLAVQIVTGIALALFYAPTPDHAWDSVRYISTGVRGGAFLRGLHHWGASLVVIAAVVHLARVVVFGSYRKPREVNWVIGLILLHVILALGLTGYLLPWDQRAYWATVVAINMSKLTPVAGEWVAAVLRGGDDIGALTLTRWYAMHVLVLPAALVSLAAAHVYLMRRHGISGPVTPRSGPSQLFFPSQAARDFTMAAIAGLLLAALAWKGAPPLESPADPTSTDYVPRPDWYFLGLFQLLKYFPGRWEVIGVIVIPGLVMAFLILLPWLDRGRTREPRRRLSVLLPFTASIVLIGALTVLGALDAPVTNPAARWTIREIAGAALVQTDDRCVRCHNAERSAGPVEPGRITRTADWLAAHVADPEVIAAGIRQPPALSTASQADSRAMIAALARLRSGPPPPVDAETTHVYTLVSRFCLNCHVIDGVGGKDGPELSHAGIKLSAAAIEQRIIDPFSVDPDAEMPSLADKIAPEDIRKIAGWLAQRK